MASPSSPLESSRRTTADLFLNPRVFHGPFDEPEEVETVLRLRRALVYEETDLGLLLLAADVGGTMYFYCPEGDRLWSAGLEGCERLAEAFRLFGSLAQIMAFVEERPPSFSQLVVYKPRLEDGNIRLREIQRIDLIDMPVIYYNLAA